MEPLRPIIDLEIRKAINLGQCKEEDFQVFQNQYSLDYKKNANYIGFIMDAIMNYKEDIFLFIRGYYRAFMKGKDIKQYTLFELKK